MEEPIYEFSNFLKVLSTGWNDEAVLEIADDDYTDLLHLINYHYQVA